MEELHVADDQSHYEISLTAGQAFVSFVLLLLSLAAAFAFGLMIGKGQSDDRLVVQKATPVVTEAGMTAPGKKTSGEIVELGVSPKDDFEETAATDSATTVTATETATATPAVIEEAPAPATETAAASTPAAAATTPSAIAQAPRETPAPGKVTTYAQLLSTLDQKTAEALAVRLINKGFNSAYVERGTASSGAIYRVRVKFESEADARAAEPKLREFSKDVWITSK